MWFYGARSKICRVLQSEGNVGLKFCVWEMPWIKQLLMGRQQLVAKHTCQLLANALFMILAWWGDREEHCC